MSLLEALSTNNYELVKTLIRNSDDVLFSAIEENNYELVKKLIDIGIELGVKLINVRLTGDPYENENIGLTPLMCASKYGHKEICELLIDKGANINAGSNYVYEYEHNHDCSKSCGSTALMFASEEGHKEICELLISKGANINIKNTDGKTAFMYAFESDKENEEICDLLRSYAKEEKDDHNTLTQLMCASRGGYKKICEDLIAKGAEINAQDEDDSGKTALIFASEKGHKQICELLIANGADVNLEDEDGKTAYMYAYEKGYSEICELLIANGAVG